MDLTKKDLIYGTTFGLYTKFIKAEREHKCGKIHVSPALTDTWKGGRALMGRLRMWA
jgi:hypothetical protein